MKPRIAIFSLTGCEGCSLAILELEEQLLDLLDAVEIVNFREGMTERAWDIDIGFVDGAVTTPRDEEEAKRFRAACKTLVAIGSCASFGGINTLKHHQPSEEYRQCVYGEAAAWYPTAEARALAAVVPVEYALPGCPLIGAEFLRLVKCVLAGRPFKLPRSPVCVECKQQGNVCRYESGQFCLGPVTRGGCDALCPRFGTICEGCRGLADQDALAALGQNGPQQHGVSRDELLERLRLYGAYQGATLP